MKVKIDSLNKKGRGTGNEVMDMVHGLERKTVFSEKTICEPSKI